MVGDNILDFKGIAREIDKILDFKGIAREILTDLPWEKCNAQFTTVPLQALPLYVWICYRYLSIIHKFCLYKKVTCAFLLQENINELSELNTI